MGSSAEGLKHRCAALHGMDATSANGFMPHLSRESTVESEPDLGHEASKGLVEEVAQELADAEISPAAMDEQEVLEVGELRQGIVAALHGLCALQPTDAHPDVGGCRGQEGVKGRRGGFQGAGCLISLWIAPRLRSRG